MAPKRRAQLQSGTGGMAAGSGTGALLLHFASALGKDSAGAHFLIYLVPFFSIVTSGAVIWLRSEVDDFVQRKLEFRKLAFEEKQRSRREQKLRNFIASTADESLRTQATRALSILEQERLKAI